MEKGSELVMNWMGSVATSVMGPHLVSRSEDNSGPLNRMPKLWSEGLDSMDDIEELPKRNRSLMLSTLLPSVENLDYEARVKEMHSYLSCMKHEHAMHSHSSRCIPHNRMGKGDNSDCAGGFKPGPPNQSKHTWDAELKQLSLQRDRTKLICHNVAILLFLKATLISYLWAINLLDNLIIQRKNNFRLDKWLNYVVTTLQSMIPKLIFMLENN
jgi:hypothetical protein